MNREELKAAQTPIKQQYRDDPGSATITLRAIGGLGDGITSGDMVLQALVACAGVTLRSVATSLQLEISGTVRAEGDLDFRGTLGVDKDTPVGFTDIRLSFDLDRCDADQDQLDTLLRLTERYCVVFQTLANPPSLSASMT
jgi:uncharacterized OsmC-like protein